MSSVFAESLLQRLATTGRRLLVAGALVTGQPVLAADAPTVQVHGFAAQSAMQTTGNYFFGNTAGRVSGELQEAGINARWQPSPEWHVAGQLLSRHAGETDHGDPRIDYLFVGYSPVLNEQQRLTVMLGKTKLPYGLYNDTRDTPAARPSIVLPQSIYLDRLRDAYQSGIGGQLSGEQSLGGDAYLTASAASFRVEANGKNVARGLLTAPTGEMQGRESWTAQVIAHFAEDRFKLGVTRANIRLDYTAGVADAYRNGTVEFAPWVYSALWQGERWSLAAEYLTRSMKYRQLIANTDLPGESGYVQGTWRFSSQWEALLRYDVYYMNSDDRSGQRTAARSRLPAWTYYAKDWAVSLRYRFAPGWHVAGEMHSVDGTGWLPPADKPAGSATPRHWNLYLLQLGYQF